MSSHNLTIEEMDRNELEDALRDAYDENESLLDRINELEANQPKWISVKERMPKERQIVITLNGGYIQIDVYLGLGWCCGANITHWMPFPPHPTEDFSATEKEDK